MKIKLHYIIVEITYTFMYYLYIMWGLSFFCQESIESANTTIEDEDVKGRGFFFLFFLPDVYPVSPTLWGLTISNQTDPSFVLHSALCR